MKIKRYKLKPEVKKIMNIILLLLLGALIGIAIYQLFTIKTIKSTPAGNYECNGGLIKICSGSKEVADYLGV